MALYAFLKNCVSCFYKPNCSSSLHASHQLVKFITICLHIRTFDDFGDIE